MGLPINGTISSIAISGDGEYVTAGVSNGDQSDTGAVLLFDRSGNVLWQYKTDEMIGRVSISEDGSHILANGYRTTYALDLNGSVVWTQPGYSVAMSADGSEVAVLSPGHWIAVLTWQRHVVWNSSVPVNGCGGSGVCPVAMQNGTLFVDGEYDPYGIMALGSAGALLWETPEANNLWTGGAAFAQGRLIVAAFLDAGRTTTGQSCCFPGVGTCCGNIPTKAVRTQELSFLTVLP